MAQFQATATDIHDSTTGKIDSDEIAFQKGERVFILLSDGNSGLTTTGALKRNGGHRRHGHIVAVGSQNCAIHFDAGNGVGKFQTVLVSPNRIKHEQDQSSQQPPLVPLSCTIQDRANVINGALVHGSPIHDGIQSTTATYNAAAMTGMMHLIRWIAATSCSTTGSATSSATSDEVDPVPTMPKIYDNLSLVQIQQISSDDCHTLNEMAIKNWDRVITESHDDSIPTTSSTIGVYDRLVQYLRNTQKIRSGWVIDAVLDIRAVQSWHRSIQYEFWFVGKDDTGSYVIPNCRSHEHVVYKVVGFGGPSNQPALGRTNDNNNTARAPVRLIRVPMCLRITILPWYGRILHDTSIPLPSSQPGTTTAMQMATDPSTAHRLHTVLLHSVQSGTVIEYFAELESLPK